MFLLYSLCAVLALAVILLSVKLYLDRRAIESICESLNAKLTQDTNTLITVSSGDRSIRRLAAALNGQLRILRSTYLQYKNGDRELKNAVTNLAHDLRTPLTAICGHLELLEKENLPPKVQDDLRILSNRALAMKKLTEEMLQYSIAGSSDAYEAREEVSLNREIESCIASFYGAFTQKGINPQIEMPETHVTRQLNSAAIQRIFSNIISNALRYGERDLSVTLNEQGEMCFSNYAPQLDTVSVGKLFDRFYTVESAQGGTGLGLSIAKLLTEQLGGSITAAKEGDLFTILIFFPQVS